MSENQINFSSTNGADEREATSIKPYVEGETVPCDLGQDQPNIISNCQHCSISDESTDSVKQKYERIEAIYEDMEEIFWGAKDTIDVHYLWKPIEGWLGMEGKLNRENMKLLLSVATEAQIYMAMIQQYRGEDDKSYLYALEEDLDDIVSTDGQPCIHDLSEEQLSNYEKKWNQLNSYIDYIVDRTEVATECKL